MIMGTIKKVFLNIIGFVILPFLVFIGIVILSFKINEHEAKNMRKYIGVELITKKDTLSVISFSTTKNTFMLSNGITVNDEMIYEIYDNEK